jgi:hypothetical protein
MHMQAEFKDILGRTFAEVAGTDEELPAPPLGLKFPAILVVENECRLTLVKAELDFVTEQVHRITEQRFGPSLVVARYASRLRASGSARE